MYVGIYFFLSLLSPPPPPPLPFPSNWRSHTRVVVIQVQQRYENVEINVEKSSVQSVV